MATNTAPQWLKNTGIFDHSTLYLLCFIASCILYTINLSKHVSVNLVIPMAHCIVQLAQCALRYITCPSSTRVNYELRIRARAALTCLQFVSRDNY